MADLLLGGELWPEARGDYRLLVWVCPRPWFVPMFIWSVIVRAVVKRVELRK